MQRHMVLSLASFFLWSSIFSCDQDLGLRDKIAFKDMSPAVADSILKMENLLYKLPESSRINYFIDDGGDLYVNNEKLGSLKGAINDLQIRNSEAFDGFTENEVTDFFHLMAFLLRNYIDGAYMNSRVSRFLFEYRRTPEGRFSDLRLITPIKGGLQNDTFLKEYIILDRDQQLALVAPQPAAK